MNIKNYLDSIACVLIDPSHHHFTAKDKQKAWMMSAVTIILTGGIIHLASAVWRRIRHVKHNDTHQLISQVYRYVFHKAKSMPPSNPIAPISTPADSAASVTDRVTLGTTIAPSALRTPIVPSQKKLNKQILFSSLNGFASSRYKFLGYGLPKISIGQAASQNSFKTIKENMTLTTGVEKPGIGKINHCYIWKEKPSLNAIVPSSIQNGRVRLPDDLSFEEFDNMRMTAQRGAVNKGVDDETAQRLALQLKGVVIEATLPYKAADLLQDENSDVYIHCIFQTGLNCNGKAGGGIPLTDFMNIEKNIENYVLENAKAALSSAIANQSDVLVFNLGIGAGFFAGKYANQVRKANIKSLCHATDHIRQLGNEINVIVPQIPGITSEEGAMLKKSGIIILEADKGAVAALCARQGCTVSESIAGDPMSMLGIHGPGFWWESVGSASDEERVAFLTPCYALGHTPIDIYKRDTKRKIAALSEFMVKSHPQSKEVSKTQDHKQRNISLSDQGVSNQLENLEIQSKSTFNILQVKTLINIINAHLRQVTQLNQQNLENTHHFEIMLDNTLYSISCKDRKEFFIYDRKEKGAETEEIILNHEMRLAVDKQLIRKILIALNNKIKENGLASLNPLDAP